MREIDSIIAEAMAELDSGECGKCRPANWQRRIVYLLEQVREVQRVQAWQRILDDTCSNSEFDKAVTLRDAGVWPKDSE